MSGGGDVGTSSSNARCKREVVVAPIHLRRLPDDSEHGDDTHSHPCRMRTRMRGNAAPAHPLLNVNWRGASLEDHAHPKASFANTVASPFYHPTCSFYYYYSYPNTRLPSQCCPPPASARWFDIWSDR